MSTITEFANELYENSRAKGFYELEDWLREQLHEHEALLASDQDAGRGYSAADEKGLIGKFRAMIAEHYGNRLLLIVGEAVEAHEELRAGRGVGELYFSGDLGEGEHGTTHFAELNGVLLKPEGVLAELADVAIRSLETIAGILANMEPDEMVKLRSQVPQSEYTGVVVEAGDPGSVYPGPVNVAEILNLKHEFNLSRAPKHGGKAF